MARPCGEHDTCKSHVKGWRADYELLIGQVCKVERKKSVGFVEREWM